MVLAAEKLADVVTVRVTDYGPGIPKKVADKQFQSFRTTKGSGEKDGRVS
jgi:C4-dicarboxylate-specific signal transduction histidine kinase